jgi:benzoyl-CoA reductase/2-hydroxyglutaryl-CoA dehydratase subunit BcrC/BadD/HgdB
VDVQGKILVLNRYEMVDDRFPLPAKESIRKVIADNIAKLEDALGSGAYIYDLPVKYQIEDHYLNLDIDGFYDYLESLKLVEVTLEDFRSAINRLTRKKTNNIQSKKV